MPLYPNRPTRMCNYHRAHWTSKIDELEGEIKVEDRQHIASMLFNGELDIVFVQSVAGSTELNLQGANHVILYQSQVSFKATPFNTRLLVSKYFMRTVSG